MGDPARGRGRGLALLRALKAQLAESPSSQEPSPEPTPAPSVAPSFASSVSTMPGGRGKMAAMLLSKIQKPGGDRS